MRHQDYAGNESIRTNHTSFDMSSRLGFNQGETDTLVLPALVLETGYE